MAAAETLTLAENSEVPPKLPPPRSGVAVAVMTWPTVVTTPDRTAVKLALPTPFVVTSTWPR